MPTGIYKHKKLSEETKNKISIAMKGIKKLEEHKKNISKGKKGKHSNPKNEFKSYKKHWNWKGGRIKSSENYILIYYPMHQNCNSKGYVREHHLIMEKHIGRYLTKKEVVHHINGIRNDNRIENLKLFKNQNDHLKFHKNLKN